MSVSQTSSTTPSEEAGEQFALATGRGCGGERAAVIYSLIGTAKLNNIDSESYLRYVLTHIAEHPNNHIEELLPWTIAPSLSKIPLAA